MIEQEKLKYFKPFLNWIIFFLLITFFLSLFFYSTKTENLESNWKILFLIISISFLILALRMDNGCSDLKAHYKIFLKNKTLIENLPYLPVIFVYLFLGIALFSNGKLILGILLNLAIGSFSFPITLSLLLLFFKDIIPTKK